MSKKPVIPREGGSRTLAPGVREEQAEQPAEAPVEPETMNETETETAGDQGNVD